LLYCNDGARQKRWFIAELQQVNLLVEQPDTDFMGNFAPYLQRLPLSLGLHPVAIFPTGIFFYNVKSTCVLIIATVPAELWNINCKILFPPGNTEAAAKATVARRTFRTRG
jgi:hypothetical protein